MIRNFIYGFILGFTFNVFGIMVCMTYFIAEMEIAYTAEKTAIEQKIIGCCIGFFCSVIMFVYFVYNPRAQENTGGL